MARCERGYLCAVCGREVEEVAQSALYLRYILGDVAAEELHRAPECHLACDAGLAQYIVADDFPAVACAGPFDKSTLDDEFVRGEEERVTRAWRRLRQVATGGGSLLDYPLSAASASEGGPN